MAHGPPHPIFLSSVWSNAGNRLHQKQPQHLAECTVPEQNVTDVYFFPIFTQTDSDLGFYLNVPKDGAAICGNSPDVEVCYQFRRCLFSCYLPPRFLTPLNVK